MTSRPSAFETRLAALAQDGAVASQVLSALEVREEHLAGRRRTMWRVLAALGLAGAAFGTTVVSPDSAPLSLGALALGLLAMAAAARLQKLTDTSVSASQKHGGSSRREFGSFRVTDPAGGSASFAGLQRLMTGGVTICFGIVALQTAALAEGFIPAAKDLPGVSQIVDLIGDVSHESSGELPGNVELQSRSGFASASCGERTSAAKWICLLGS